MTRERPVLAYIWSVVGGLVLAISGSYALSLTAGRPVLVTEAWIVTIEITSAAVVFVVAHAMLRWPEHHVAAGLLISGFGMLSVFGLLGGLCMGSFAALIGGFLAMTWQPSGRPRCVACGAAVATRTARCGACGTAQPPWPSPTRPVVAFGLSAYGLFFVHAGTVLGAVGPYPFVKFPFVEVAGAVALEVLWAFVSFSFYRHPDRHREWGTLLAVISVAALRAPYSGFYIGVALGLAGGLAAVLWRDRR